LLNKPKILVNKRFEADQEERKCKIFEGYTLKTVHFGSDKLENLGITDSSNYSLFPIPYSLFPIPCLNKGTFSANPKYSSRSLAMLNPYRFPIPMMRL
jgi:hypothetical protein